MLPAPLEALCSLSASPRFNRDAAAAAWADGVTLPALMRALLLPPPAELPAWFASPGLPRLLAAAGALLGLCESQAASAELQVRVCRSVSRPCVCHLLSLLCARKLAAVVMVVVVLKLLLLRLFRCLSTFTGNDWACWCQRCCCCRTGGITLLLGCGCRCSRCPARCW